MSDSSKIQFKLMLPSDLKQRLEVSAAEGRRSLSQEIVLRLEHTLGDTTINDILAQIRQMDEQIDRMLETERDTQQRLAKVLELLEAK